MSQLFRRSACGNGSVRVGVAFGAAVLSSFPAAQVPSVLLVPATAGPMAEAEWSDVSGNARHYVQATAAKQPALSTLAGAPCLDFDGSDDLLVSSYVPAGAKGEVWGLFQTDALGGYVWTTADHAEAGLPGTGYNRQLCYPGGDGSSGIWVQFTPNNDPNTTYFEGTTTLVSNGTPYLGRWASFDTSYKLETNGIAQTLTKRSVGGTNDGDWWSMITATLDSSVVGAHKRSIENNFLDGKIAFVAVWDAFNHATADALTWTTFLKTALGIA